VPAVLWKQQAELYDRLNMHAEARSARARERASPPGTARERYLLARELSHQGRYHEAAGLLEHAVRDEPDRYWAWFLLGICMDGLGQERRSIICYTACVALKPDFHGAYVNRASAHRRLKELKAARADFDRAVTLAPARIESWFDRALVKEDMNDFKGAIDD